MRFRSDGSDDTSSLLHARRAEARAGSSAATRERGGGDPDGIPSVRRDKAAAERHLTRPDASVHLSCETRERRIGGHVTAGERPTFLTCQFT